MSLDGYVAGPNDSIEEPMGVGGFRLFNWLDRRDDPGPNRQVVSEMRATRAVARAAARTNTLAAGRATITTACRFSS
jgi:hypothetical protein